MVRPNLENAFVDGGEMVTGQGTATLKLHDLGQLILTTGRIVACDPLVFPETEPFPVSVPPGKYPVIVSVARFEDQDQRVAYATLRFSDGVTARWEPALLPGQDVGELEEEEFFGYAVDSGTGCFMDAEVAGMLADRMAEDDEWAEGLLEEFDKNHVNTWGWVNALIPAETGANIIAFSSGWGDGGYPSYWGFDRDGNIVNLVTDFCL